MLMRGVRSGAGVSASMLDEVEIPTKKQPLFICPCCKFTFMALPKFVLHCTGMKMQIDAALRVAGAGK